MLLAICLVTAAASARADGDPFAECRSALARVHRALLLIVWSGDAVPSTYEPAQKILAAQKARLSPQEYARFERWYLDHFFMDRADAITSNATDASAGIGPTTRFDTAITSPYFGYRKARRFLSETDLASLNMGSLNQAHSYLLSGFHLQIIPSFFTRRAPNSEGTASDKIGRVRDVTTNFGSAEISHLRIGLTRMTSDGGTVTTVPLTAIHDVNPYLFFKTTREGGEAYGDRVYYTPLSEWRQFQDKLSPQLKERLLALEAKIGVIPSEELEAALAAEDAKQDEIVNQAVERQRQKLLKQLERGDIDQSRFASEAAAEERRIRRAYEDDRKAALNKISDKHFGLNFHDKARPLAQEFISELVADRWVQLRREMAVAKTRERMIDVIASFHYDFLSLHPYANGNGRMARLLTERLLAEFGLPPPVWTHFGEDVLLSKSDFTKLFRDSLTLSHEFHKDLEFALENGLPHDMVVLGTLLPGVTPSVLARNNIDPSDFMAWIAASKYYTTDVPSVVHRYLRWRDLKDVKEWRLAPVKLATTAHVAEFGTLSPSIEAYNRRRNEGYDSTVVISSHRTKVPPAIQDVLDLFSKGRLMQDPTAALVQFNATMVRNPELAAPWLSTGFFSGDPAAKAGVVRAYSDLSAAQSNATGGGRYRTDVWFARPKFGSLDAKFLADLSAAPEGKTKGVHLIAGGIEAEAVDSVVVTSTTGERLYAAKRIDFRTIEISEFVGAVATPQRYQWTPGSGWTAR